MDRLRMRTTLLIPLLVLSFSWTVVSLLIVRTIVQQQISASLASDLKHSVRTFQNLQRQRRELLFRESALLADLPSLKALMTAPDARTIEDAGTEFWKVSGSDFFALLDTNGKLIAEYNRGPALARVMVENGMGICLQRPEEALMLPFGDRLYEVSTQPLYFGAQDTGTPLGFVAVGYAVDQRVAREVSEAAAAEVAFAVNGKIVASTLEPGLQIQLVLQADQVLRVPMEGKNIQLGAERYLAQSVRLSDPDTLGFSQLVVLKSFAQATRLVRHVNQWVAALGLLALVIGTAMVVSISRNVTHPLQILVEGTRALGQGKFDYELSECGAEEVRELSRSFDHMRIELRHTQQGLLESERLATIGSMASSISHDLRHHLSAMYANAEFMSDAHLAQPEREELLEEVRSAMHGMTDMLDSLLLFTQTGRTLHPECESLDLMIQRAVSMVRLHPEAREVQIAVSGLSSLEAWIDAKKLGRAVYNLLLNGCQAAKRGKAPARVMLSVDADESVIRMSIVDSGPGISESIRKTMFLPFVSEGKESGIGLGLTLAQQIAEEHGGRVCLEKTSEGYTAFTIILQRAALERLGVAVERRAIQTQSR